MLVDCSNIIETDKINTLPRNDGVSRIYELIKEGEVVYVGQSVNMYARLNMHKFLRGDSNYKVRHGECNPSLISDIEAKNIVLSNPIENKNIPSNNLIIKKERAMEIIIKNLGIEMLPCFTSGSGFDYYNAEDIEVMAAKLLEQAKAFTKKESR